LWLNKKPPLSILLVKIQHDNDNILKNGYSKKGNENFYLSSGTNKSISNFRETIPLKCFPLCTNGFVTRRPNFAKRLPCRFSVAVFEKKPEETHFLSQNSDAGKDSSLESYGVCAVALYDYQVRCWYRRYIIKITFRICKVTNPKFVLFNARFLLFTFVKSIGAVPHINPVFLSEIMVLMLRSINM
jgi:hypothetical protein